MFTDKPLKGTLNSYFLVKLWKLSYDGCKIYVY